MEVWSASLHGRGGVNVFHYPRVFLRLARNNLAREMQYRTSFSMRIIERLAWFLITILFFRIVYLHVAEIGGWTFHEVLLLTATFEVLHGSLFGLFIWNLPRIQDMVTRGMLDVYLTKPVNAQFLLSLLNMSVSYVLSIATALVVLGYAASRLGVVLTPLLVLLYASALVAGLVVSYALWFMLMTVTFWTVRISSIHEIFINLYDLARYPAPVFEGWAKLIFLFVFPVVITTNIPAGVFAGKSNPLQVMWLFLAAGILLIASHLFWNFGIRRYTSAGG